MQARQEGVSATGLSGARAGEGGAGTGNRTAEAGDRRDSPAGVGGAVDNVNLAGTLEARAGRWAGQWGGGAGGSAGEGRGGSRGAPPGRGGKWARRDTDRTGLPAAGPPRPPGGVAGRDELGWGPLGSLLQDSRKSRPRRYRHAFQRSQALRASGLPRDASGKDAFRGL